MTLKNYLRDPSNMAYHNLCSRLQVPIGIKRLLGLGHKYCIERTRPHVKISKGVYRLTRAVRIRYHLGNGDEDEDSYNPNLYVASDWQPPLIPNANMEARLMKFSDELDVLFKNNRARSNYKTNLSKFQYNMMQEMRQDRRFIICLTDKNLGPAILERDVYINRALQDHLLKPANYQQLDPDRAKIMMNDTNEQLKALYGKLGGTLNKAERTYFKRSRIKKEPEYQTPQFYITITRLTRPHGRPDRS